MSDVKILLISHAHFDHDAGAASDQADDRRQVHGHGGPDVSVVESGGKTDFFISATCVGFFVPGGIKWIACCTMATQ